MTEKIILAVIVLASITTVYFHYYTNGFYRKLFRLEDVLSGELDYFQLSKSILQKVIHELAANSGLLYWHDDTKNEFKLKTLHDIPTDRISILTKLLKQPGGFFERLEQEPVPIVINLNQIISADDSKEFGQLKTFCKNFMLIPLINNKKLQGVLIIFSNRNFDQKQILLMKYFAPHMAVHLDNARLYQLTKETAVENARLYLNLSKLYQQATSDELTGLYNRNFMMQRLKEELKKAWRFKQPLAIIFADVDFFKKVNDEYGHQMGDRLLTEFGELLKSSVREYDVACRFGGEEFVILLPHTTLENAEELAERLRRKTQQHYFCEPEKQLTITASFGVSATPIFPETLPSPEAVDQLLETLIARADEALYEAKENGRNLVKSKPTIL